MKFHILYTKAIFFLGFKLNNTIFSNKTPFVASFLTNNEK